MSNERIKSFGLPGTINGHDRMKITKRDADGNPVLVDGKEVLEAKPMFIPRAIKTKIIRRDHEGKIIPGPTEIEINMSMDRVTRKAIPGTGQKVLAQVVEVDSTEYIPNPEYFEPVKDDAGNVKSFKGYNFTTSGVRKLAMPENYEAQTQVPLMTQADARVIAAQKESSNLKEQVTEQNAKIDNLTNLITELLNKQKENEKPVEEEKPVVGDTGNGTGNTE